MKTVLKFGALMFVGYSVGLLGYYAGLRVTDRILDKVSERLEENDTPAETEEFAC